MSDLSRIWNEVSGWPPDDRRALADHILQSLQQSEAFAQVPSDRRDALQQLVGIWKMQRPPTDEQIDRMIEEERIKKYA